MASIERHCTLLLVNSEVSSKNPNPDTLAKQLESKDDKEKIKALKEIIITMLAGNQLPRLLMPVIKFCLRSDNHTIKKLLMTFWEIVDKKDPNTGKMKTEMILVCNHLLNDLEHANEYIRGSALRLLTKLDDSEILEQLIPAVLANLDHRHSYVRKNAALSIYSIFQQHPELLPDAPQRIEKFLNTEGNDLAKRNAFLMLYHCDQRRAVDFLGQIIEQVPSMTESFQMVVLELIRKVCRSLPVARSAYMKCVFSLLESNSNTVILEAANTLLALSSLDTAVKSAIGALTTLLTHESDQNVKLIILNRLDSLKHRYSRQLGNSIIDILRTLATPNIDIRKKTLKLGLALTTAQNVNDFISFLKKEIISTESADDQHAVEYRNVLVEAIHKCAVKYPEVAANVVHLLMNYLGDENSSSSRDVVYFVREIVEAYPKLRKSILEKLIDNFLDIRNSSVYRVALWILGSYATDSESNQRALDTIYEGVGDLPLVKDEDDESDGNDSAQKKNSPAKAPVISTRTVVLDDGTYAQQSSMVETAAAEEEKQEDKAALPLRALLSKGDYFLATALSATVTKLTLMLSNADPGSRNTNAALARAMLLMTSILRLGESAQVKKKIERDSVDRITICIRTLLNPGPCSKVFTDQCRQTYTEMINEQKSDKVARDSNKTVEVVKPADTFINIRHLKGVRALNQFDLDDDDDVNIEKAVGNPTKGQSDFASRLKRVFQLTGFSDPVYAEACVTVHQFDIILDILVINKTGGTLQNLTVELQTSGDLKLVDQPQKYTLAAGSSQRIPASIKVSSTETGIIFGNIVYNKTGASADAQIVVMNSIHMDILDYIEPGEVSASKFSDMWAEFEWENKVPVATDIQDLNDYLRHIMKITNMNCLTPQTSMTGDCQFMAANLYARSIFGEDALLNLSVAKNATDGRIGGYIRIRSKTQGIALSLGDKITAKQRVALKVA